MNGKLASENFFWKWISLTEGENDKMGIPNSRDKIEIERQERCFTLIKSLTCILIKKTDFMLYKILNK